jgi:hypothetical protein
MDLLGRKISQLAENKQVAECEEVLGSAGK